jgi:glycosyltransferase involved in cell wall biosynthesis
MAAGCPVISTNHAAIPETVINGETGLIVPKRDPQSLANAISFFVNNNKMLKKMRKKSYRRYKKLYTAEKSNSILIKSFSRVLP